jgi:2-iminobutanoate/2-iminopropanoate deaminase
MENVSSAIEGISTTSAPSPAGHYSQAVVSGNLVFVAGQSPKDPSTGELPEGAEAQTRQVLRNIQAILEAAGTSMDKVLKVTAHLASLDDFASYDGVFAEFFTEPYPARTTVGSQLKGILVEIDVVAVR